MKIGVIGAGVAGITAAYILSKKHTVTLIERNDYLGGHTNTIVVEDPTAGPTPIDTGFIVCNRKNYPNFYQLLGQLGIQLRDSDMSFGYFSEGLGLGYTGPSLKEFLRQSSNLLKFRFVRMLLEQRRFNKRALSDLNADQLNELPLGDYLERLHCSDYFIENYLIPVSAAIWSSPDVDMMRFPTETFVTFFRNHGMLEFSKRPTWQTVVGGSFAYVRAFREKFKGQVLSSQPVVGVSRSPDGASVRLDDGTEMHFDHVVLATHADETLKLLSDPAAEERELLSSWTYHENETVLHFDDSVMPPNRNIWASWNYFRAQHSDDSVPVSITYHMNRLQGLKTERDYFVTLNRTSRIDPNKILYKVNYTHPAYTPSSTKAQRGLRELNGQNSTSFCGSYMGYGFHEDAVTSSVEVAENLGVSL